MAEGDHGGDRTEAATSRHLDQARDKGQAPVSREAVTFAVLAALTLLCSYQLRSITRGLLPHLMLPVARTGVSALSEAPAIHSLCLAALFAILPFLAVAALIASLAVLFQTNFLVHLASPQPKMSRVSPTAGLKRIFGFNGLIELVRSLLKLGLLITAFGIVAARDFPRLLNLGQVNPHALLSALAEPLLHLFGAALAVQGVVAAGDLLWVRYRHTQDLKMSKQEIRDEVKDTEGNAHVKARIRQIRLVRARKRMMANIPTATVVVTNPTHYAVALTYDRAKSPAPRIVAKGVDTVAARIREIAQANNIPLVENPPLARALFPPSISTAKFPPNTTRRSPRSLPMSGVFRIANAPAYDPDAGDRQAVNQGLRPPHGAVNL